MVIRSRKAFTLIELLVVITIIALLIGLAVPAVQAALAAARKATCAQRQGQVGKSFLSFENSKKRFPGYIERVGKGKLGKARSWVFAVMPYMERMSLYEDFANQGDADAEPLDQYKVPLTDLAIDSIICPVDSTTDNLKGWNSYIVNSGVPDDNVKPNLNAPKKSPLDKAIDHPENGVCHEQISRDRYTNKITADGLHDGADLTILLTENLQARFWADTDERWLSCIWTNSTTGSANSKINGNIIETAAPSNSFDYSRPSSNHNGGVNATFCDAHTIFLAETVDYPVYVAIMTPYTKNAKTLDGSPANAALRSTKVNEADLR